MATKKFERDMLKGGLIQVNRKSKNLSFKTSHWHDYFELIYYKNCEGVCHLNGKDYPLTGDAVFFLTPGDFHRIDIDEKAGSFSTVFSLSEDIIDRTLTDGSPLSARVLYSPAPLTAAAIEQIADCYNSADLLIQKQVFHLMNAILVDVIKKGEKAGNENASLHPALSKAMLIILNDPARDITLTEIAKTCGIAPAYFSHIFHKNTGKTFKKWVADIRLDRACRLLEDSDLCVLDICYECGFHTASHFGKIFRQKTGMTPRQYRNNINKKALPQNYGKAP